MMGELNKESKQLETPELKIKGWNLSTKHNLRVKKAKIERALDCENHDPTMPMCITLQCQHCADEKPREWITIKAHETAMNYMNKILIEELIKDLENPYSREGLIENLRGRLRK